MKYWALQKVRKLPQNEVCHDWANNKCFREAGRCKKGLHPILTDEYQPDTFFMVQIDPVFQEVVSYERRHHRFIFCHPYTPIKLIQDYVVKSVHQTLPPNCKMLPEMCEAKFFIKGTNVNPDLQGES